ncbi:hypothetical protein Acor_27510 [Acrocarpospora corrugata]|uniref:Uncharacterized protein n=1 Tax=Acrocarpospora corrugata TaxID=35763 RepID=A0A5M3VV75_9ACTN|nr:hypothetical protein [Acrocarpospora corrugata]GES00687.1 hypothetical protein Acor_27510 [Acrocarpospora corrugata]
MPTSPAAHLHEQRPAGPDALAAARALAGDLAADPCPAADYGIGRLQGSGLLALTIGDPGASPRVLTRIVTIIATADPALAHVYRAHVTGARRGRT